MLADLQHRFVEFETAADLRTAVEKLDTRDFKGARVNCVANVGLPILALEDQLLIVQLDPA